jgi:hypothetical protein
MPRGYRCIILAAVGWLTLGAAPEQPRQQAEAEQRQDRPAIEQSLKEIAASLKDAAKGDITTQPCRDGQDNSRSDLCAQWTAAKAAESASIAAWVFGILAALIGGLTLIAAIMAARYAKHAVDETRRGNSQNRPWLNIEPEIVSPLRIEQGRVRATVALRLKNSGTQFAVAVCARAVLIPVSELEILQGDLQKNADFSGAIYQQAVAPNSEDFVEIPVAIPITAVESMSGQLDLGCAAYVGYRSPESAIMFWTMKSFVIARGYYSEAPGLPIMLHRSELPLAQEELRLLRTRIPEVAT